jgi:hypothetical protein
MTGGAHFGQQRIFVENTNIDSWMFVMRSDTMKMQKAPQ